MFEPVSYMYYNGDLYLNGTEMILKDEYINTHTYNGKKIWKYYAFDHKARSNNQNTYFLCRRRYSFCDLIAMGIRDQDKINSITRDYAPYITIPCHELHDAIEGFTNPIKVERKKAEDMMGTVVENALHPKSDFEIPGMMALWAIYIVVMVASLIFRQFYLLWIIATILFAYLRKGVRGE